MTRIYALLFAVALTLNACATAGPLVLNCGLQDVAILAADYDQIVADYKAKDWMALQEAHGQARLALATKEAFERTR